MIVQWNKKQITGCHARDPGFDSRSRHKRVISGSFEPNKPIQPLTNHNQRRSMLTRHCISEICTYESQYTIMIAGPTHNSTEELLQPNIKAAVPVGLNQNCLAASEYYGWTCLSSGEYGLIPLPSSHSRLDKTSWGGLMIKRAQFFARSIIAVFLCT